MSNYRIIPNEQASHFLHLKIGRQSANYANNLYTVMNSMMGGRFAGGMWELREYTNGAVAMVLPDQQQVVAACYGCQQDLEISLEALSLVASAMLFVRLCEKAVLHGDEDEALHLRNLHDVLLEALAGRMDLVMRDGKLIQSEAQDLTLPREKHHEWAQIRRFLD
ncbi:hypothetical protein ACNFIA_16785 [Pseudomonas sp. NY15437]|uniref:hypothetical protein n=1 Tax=Pseudomonas sp. NY15437 TaxID=3400360 RepID=UPI003A87EE8A